MWKMTKRANRPKIIETPEQKSLRENAESRWERFARGAEVSLLDVEEQAKKDFWTVVADENDKLRKAARTDRKSYFWEDVRWDYEKPVYDAENERNKTFKDVYYAVKDSLTRAKEQWEECCFDSRITSHLPGIYKRSEKFDKKVIDIWWNSGTRRSQDYADAVLDLEETWGEAVRTEAANTVKAAWMRSARNTAVQA